ncbi:DUF6479 family protein [Streptomyces sp. Da 82-17]|uniref:DUF6479 family protein n=1 Tax=Streptomyces sp. Da 82-17 TaxID=3377116 RepID=UPI0038D3EC11
MITLLASTPANSTELAAEGWFAGVGLVVVCLALVALLLGTLLLRGRHRSRRSPARRGERARQGSDHPEPKPPTTREARDPGDFGAEGERISPHQMKGYGNLGDGRGERDRDR